MAETVKEEKSEDSDVKIEEKEVTPVGQQMMKVGNSTAGRRGRGGSTDNNDFTFLCLTRIPKTLHDFIYSTINT